MAALLRACPPAVVAAVAAGAPLWRADAFAVTLLSGAVLYWTSWERDFVDSGITYLSRAPWVDHTDWSVTNTMVVPTMTVELRALDSGFAGGAHIKQQIIAGLFDGAQFLMSEAYGPMAAPGVSLGLMGLFGGVVGDVEITGTGAVVTVKGKNNLLDQFAPRNLYQIQCNHRFCDPGCALLAASFTTAFIAGAGATRSFIPWGGSPPAAAAKYQNGQITFTTGQNAGATKTVARGSSSGLILNFPLPYAPAAGDAFTALLGCDKSFNSGSGQSCTDYTNTQHYRGFEFVPPPNAAW